MKNLRPTWPKGSKIWGRYGREIKSRWVWTKLARTIVCYEDNRRERPREREREREIKK